MSAVLANVMDSPLVCYDRQLRRCRIYSTDNDRGGKEWRVVRESFDSNPDDEVERCFPTYAEAIKWIA